LAAKPLVYVHGAGQQKRPQELKDELDLVLFGAKMPTTRVAHYSDVRWPPAGAFGGRQPGASASRSARDRVVKAAASPEVTPNAAAAAIVAATLAPSIRRAPPAGRARGRAAGRGTTTTAADAAKARRLVAQLYRSADRVGAVSSAPQDRMVAGISFPDFIFRRVVGAFASDVVDYLYGAFAEAMRAPVRQALLNGPRPGVVVAHSLGTIIAYDVLTEPAFSSFDIQLVTLGSPLGIGNVQDRLRSGTGRPNPVPTPVKQWANFADFFDPVALDRTLGNEFSPPSDFADDETVNNPAQDNHALTGYLSIAVVRSAIVAAIGT
jgi:hypothetical protein